MLGIRHGRRATAAAPLVAMILVGTGLAATSYQLWGLTPGRRAIIKKIAWFVNGAGAGILQIGYDNLAGVFVQCLPGIVVFNNLDGVLSENEIPLCGNAKDGGFVADTTLLTGTTGNIVAQTTCAGVGVGTPVNVQIEVEEV